MTAHRVRSVVALVVLALAVAAPPAPAKGIAKATVCGPATCVDRTREALRGPSSAELLLSGTPVSQESVTPEPFVRLRLGIGDGTSRKTYGRMTVDVLPRSGRMRGQDGWSQPSPGGVRLLRRLAAGVERFPAARLGLEPVVAPAPAKPVRPDPADASAGDGSSPWALPIAAAVVLAAVAGAVVVVRRRGPAAV